MYNIVNKFINYFSKGHERSVRAKKNIIASLFIKGASMAISFLLVPVVLNYVNPTKYGIWLTISSVIGWFAFFDISLGKGLRNKLTESLANNKIKLAKTYVSTTYAIVVIIFVSLFMLFLIFGNLINWSKVFNSPPEIELELGRVAFFVFTFFCLKFILKLITEIIYANQKPALVSLYNFIWHLLSLVIILIISKTTHGSLLYIAIAYSATPVFVLGLGSMYLFSKNYRNIAPSFRYIDFSYGKNLLGLGSLFFINRIAGLVLFTTDNMIITQISGPKQVTPYAISHKYFYLVLTFFEIITLPFWSAFTEAYVKKEYDWIKKITKKITNIWKYAIIMIIVMLTFSNLIYKIWLGDSVQISFTLSLLMALSVTIMTWTNIFSRFLCGVSKIRLATYITIGQGVINIPLSIFLAKNMNMGINGVILATIICILPPVFTHPIQFKKIINNKAKGIWNK